MAAVFPMFMLSVVVIRSVILFKRGTIRDKEVHAIAKCWLSGGPNVQLTEQVRTSMVVGCGRCSMR